MAAAREDGMRRKRLIASDGLDVDDILRLHDVFSRADTVQRRLGDVADE